MVKLVRVLVIVLCLVSLPLAAAPEAAGPQTGKAVYIVQLAGAPLARQQGGTADGQRRVDLESVESLRYADRLRVRQDEALAAMGRALGREPEPLHRYSVAFHGMALELTGEEADALSKLPEVTRVQLDVRHRIASDAGPAWTGVPGVWDGSGTGGLPGTKGEGMVIGVIDTGIDLDHPSFADVGGDGYDHTNPRGAGNYVGWCAPSNPDYDPALPCNDKLIGVWSYFDAGGDPRDDNGHGTHTASIAAGNHVTATVPGTSLTRQISGVAPHANLIAYDACDDEGYCWSSNLVAAIDQAVADGVDVIGMSIARYGSSPWSDSVAVALLAARNAGVFVAAALDDWGGIGAPGHAPWVLATAASTHNRRFVGALAGLSGGFNPPTDLPSQSLTTPYGPAPILRASQYGDYDCSSPFPAGTFNGQIVVCEHYPWDSEFVKGQNVQAGGAGGLILATYYSDGSFLDPVANVLPTVRLSSSDSSKLWSWLSSGTSHTGRIAGTAVKPDPANGDRLWPGSPGGGGDYGIDVLKPDVAAPGREILAAHTDAGGYRLLSGTSMAAAHAAGAAALLMDLHPGWTPAEVQSALQTTAVTGIIREDGYPAGPFDVGSGRLSLGSAARAGLVLDVTAAQYQAADPGAGGDPAGLNLPSLMQNGCILSCGWTRVVKSTLSTTSHWNVTLETPAGIGLTVVPSSFILGPGSTQTLQITATGTTATFGWKLGRIVLTETGAQAPTARLPLATFWVEHYQLTVSRGGSGSGRVTSSPAGIDCGSDCSELYPEDSSVTLTAAPDPGSVFVGWNGWDCYGTSPTCTLSMYHSRSATAYFSPPTVDKPLANRTPLKDSIDAPVDGGTWSYYYFELGSGNAELIVDLLDLDGDVNLYVRSGAKPTHGSYDCLDYYSYGTPTRRCVITNPAAGMWWVGVNNDETGQIRYTVRASWGAANDQQLTNGSPLGDYVRSSSPGGGWKYYFVDLPAGSTHLLVQLGSLSADADLYVRHEAKPDRSNHDCESSQGATVAESCSIANPAAGRWWVGVNNFSAGTVTYLVQAGWGVREDVATDFYTITPCRLLDTRGPGQSALGSGASRVLQIAGTCGIPATARAVSVNVTATGATSAGYVVLYPGGGPPPLTSTVNFRAGQTRANNALLSLDFDGAGTLGAVPALQSGGQVHLILDVNGYFE